jgi:hypothetical protein
VQLVRTRADDDITSPLIGKSVDFSAVELHGLLNRLTRRRRRSNLDFPLTNGSLQPAIEDEGRPEGNLLVESGKGREQVRLMRGLARDFFLAPLEPLSDAVNVSGCADDSYSNLCWGRKRSGIRGAVIYDAEPRINVSARSGKLKFWLVKNGHVHAVLNSLSS